MQTVFVVAPGWQSVDSWLPIAAQCDPGDTTIVFPYLWTLDRIPEGDSLRNIITKYNFKVGFRVAPFNLFIKVENLQFFAQISELLLYLRRPFLALGKPNRHGLRFQDWISHLRELTRATRHLHKMEFQENGILVWDLINLASEPRKRMNGLLKQTKSWTRVSINVSSIYIEDPDLTGAKISERDYVLSFSPAQTTQTLRQYGLPKRRVIPITVPKFSHHWIQQLSSMSLTDYSILSPYVFLVSRGADPPLLSVASRLELLYEIIREVCQNRKLRLLVKLHPNEDKASFGSDLMLIQSKFDLDPSALSLVNLTNDHILTVAKHAEFGVVMYSSTIADMVFVGCPAIQFLNLDPSDGQDLRLQKLLFDYGFADIASDADSFRSIVESIIDHRSETVVRQQKNWRDYFYTQGTDDPVEILNRLQDVN